MKRNKVWNLKTITIASMLLAISVVLVLLGSFLAGLSSLPQFRGALGGIPVKVAGALFGPVVGAVTGGLANLLSLVIFPTFYHPGYTLNMILAGLIPGFANLILRRRTKTVNNNIFSFLTLILLIGFTVGMTYVSTQNDTSGFEMTDQFESLHTMASTYAISGVRLFGLIVFASTNLITGLIVLGVYFANLRYRKLKKPTDKQSTRAKTLQTAIPIMFYVIISDIILMLLTPLWDQSLLNIPYVVGLIARMVWTPFKTWVNIIVILVVFRNILSKTRLASLTN